MAFRFLAAWVGVWVARQQADQIEYLKTVNRSLLERLGKKRLRFTDAERRNLAVLGKKLGRKALAEVATIATPDTILRWYRELVAKKYDGSGRRCPGRPRTAAEIVRLLVEMATRNTGWGLHAASRCAQERRVRGRSEHDQEDLEGAGHRAGGAASAAVFVGDVYQNAFERHQRGGLLHGRGAELDRAGPLPRLFRDGPFESAGRDRGYIACPDGQWMEQVARNLLDAGDGFLLGKRYLILDRDPLYTREFRTAMKRGGLEVLRLPPSSPNLNAYAERFVLTIRSECLDRIVPLGEAHLRRSISEFVRHYRFERNHQGLGNELIEGPPSPANMNGRVERREGLGGLLNFYHRAAA